jgi:hypothetical protein
MSFLSHALRVRVLVCSLVILPSAFAAENTAATAPNSDPTYQQLRNIGLGGDAVSVSNLVSAVPTGLASSCALTRL